jgi:hypothetical protein
MANINSHRVCGSCDCRDQATFIPDPNLFNPLCCNACPEGQKPPCGYVIQFECPIQCPGSSEWISSPGGPTVLRPLCHWTDACNFVSRRTTAITPWNGGWGLTVSGAGGSPLSSSDGCSWIQQAGISGQTIFNYQSALTQIGWTLGLGPDRPLLKHALGYKFQAVKTWNCYGPNTMQVPGLGLLLPGSVGNTPPPCPAMPNTVCVTPIWQLYQTNPPQCPTCFKLTIPAANIPLPGNNGSVVIPEQTVVLLNNGGSLVGTQIQAAASYSNQIWCWSSLGGPGQVVLWIVNDIHTGGSSSAYLEIAGISSSQFGPGPYQVALLHCSSFTCANGGTFTGTINSVSVSVAVTPSPCVNSINDEYGLCPIQCNDRGVISNQQDQIGDPYRCECVDDWCDSIPGGFRVFGSFGLSTNCFGSYCQTGFQDVHGWNFGCWQLGGTAYSATPANQVRYQCLTLTNGHTICLNVYCAIGMGGAAWTCDITCDGTFVTSCGVDIFAACPMQANGVIPAIPGCGVTGGCLGINVDPNCQPAACCNVTSFHMTFTSSCTYLNGQTVFMSGAAGGPWSGTTASVGGFSYIINVTCSGGVYTLSSVHTANCILHGTSSAVTCSPVISGNITGGFTVPACTDAQCRGTDTWTAIISA